MRERALCRAAHALTAVTVPGASSQAAPRHTSTAIEQPGWDEGFPGMPQASSPTLTAVSEVVANDGRTRGTSLNTNAAHLATRDRPAPPVNAARAHYLRPVTAPESLPRGDRPQLRDQGIWSRQVTAVTRF